MERLPHSGKQRNTVKALLPILGIIALITVCAIVATQRITLCDNRCTYSFNTEAEALVNEAQTMMTRTSSEDGSVEDLKISGYLDEIRRENGQYSFVFENFFERTIVDDSVPQYMFSVGDKQCDADCQTKIQELTDRRTDLALNELTTIEIQYQIAELNFYKRISFVVMKVIASFKDFQVDASRYAEMTLNYSVMDKQEIQDACAGTVASENIITLGADLYNGILDVMSNTSLISTDEQPLSADIADRFFTYGWFTCDSCSGSCIGDNDPAIGLDYTFFPMLAVLLEEREAGIDTTIAREILGRSYGVDTPASFQEFIQIDKGRFNSDNTTIMWGYEPICSPYYVAGQLGQSETEYAQLSKKLCYERAENYLLGDGFSEQYGIQRYTDDEVFADLMILLEDYDTFIQLDLVAGKVASDGYIMRAMDDYVYGYEMADERYVWVGNQGLLYAVWDFVQRYDIEPGAADNFAIKNKFRDIILALLLKKELANNPGVTDRVDRLIEAMLLYVGDSEYVSKAFDTSDNQIEPFNDVHERYRVSLGKLLRLWATDQAFYTEHIDIGWEDAAKSWFFNHYMSDECGKVDNGYFIGFDSDGKCIEEYVGIRNNISTMIYLLLLYGNEV